jgi:hypothetical protein
LKKVKVACGLGLMVLVLAVSAGCGGSPDPASQIRANQKQMLAAIRDNNLAKFCSYMTDRGKCIGSMAMAKTFLGSGQLSDLLTEKELEAAEKAVATGTSRVSQDGTRATADDGGDEPETWVESEGEWKQVWD